MRKLILMLMIVVMAATASGQPLSRSILRATQYVATDTIKSLTGNGINFWNNRIKMLADPVNPQDAVNLRTLQDSLATVVGGSGGSGEITMKFLQPFNVGWEDDIYTYYVAPDSSFALQCMVFNNWDEIPLTTDTPVSIFNTVSGNQSYEIVSGVANTALMKAIADANYSGSILSDLPEGWVIPSINELKYLLQQDYNSGNEYFTGYSPASSESYFSSTMVSPSDPEQSKQVYCSVYDADATTMRTYLRQQTASGYLLLVRKVETAVVISSDFKFRFKGAETTVKSDTVTISPYTKTIQLDMPNQGGTYPELGSLSIHDNIYVKVLAQIDEQINKYGNPYTALSLQFSVEPPMISKSHQVAPNSTYKIIMGSCIDRIDGTNIPIVKGVTDTIDISNSTAAWVKHYLELSTSVYYKIISTAAQIQNTNISWQFLPPPSCALYDITELNLSAETFSGLISSLPDWIDYKYTRMIKTTMTPTATDIENATAKGWTIIN